MSNPMSCTEVDKFVQKEVKPKRYLHSVSVAETAVYLNSRFSCGLEKDDCYNCGLLHDIARNWEAGDLLLYTKKHSISLEKEEVHHPQLLHAPVGASIVKDLGFESYEDAIRWHTLGSKNMGKLGLIIYLADYLEPRRSYLTDSQRVSYIKMESLEIICLNVLKQMKHHFKDNAFSFA
ncbi:MAG: bis(5'-nucleosyl)-tetraphosphatase (symmetrical) YqeK, partial [Sphaerochaetaceae bacterium]|nr:bis(5'-nucleosyl)-tetraphosphatase (symmetrical) YqeK [Sphaerochaetaceae bacterium]